MSTIPGILSGHLEGHYRVERELGAGGMATVYLAHDVKHDRKVALKVLKPELAAVLGAERFIVEIRTTAALQHPHILPLFDSGTAGGFLFYVMPFIDGETLRAKLDRETQLGIDEAVRIASAVSDALDYAHRHGVIHRDIKPENILLHDGRPMVADFGIALAVSAAAGGRMTETGLSLGTPHYMSPEQATAEKEITGRSDIYSLGSVLHEMLTGNPPHIGASAQQIIMKIITEQAEPVTKFRKSVPPNVAAAVARSLEKLPADRFETAKAFGDALANASYTGTSLTTAGIGNRRHGARVFTAPLIAATVLAVIGLSGWATTALRRTPLPVKRARFAIIVPDSARMRPDYSFQNFTISPDGSNIVYRGGSATDQLWLRNLNDLVPRALTGTEGAAIARFSPDGRWLTFVQNGALRKLPVQGGPAVMIADSAATYAWGDDGVIVFAKRGALYRVSGAGGVPTRIAAPDSAKLQQYVWPFVLPGSRSILFDIVTNGVQTDAQLAAMRLSDGNVIQLGLAGRNPRYVSTGHLLFGRLDGTVNAAPFDARKLRVTGPAVTVLENVYIKGGGASEFGVANDGTLFYVQGNANGDIVLADHAGQFRRVVSEKRNYGNLRYSPTSDRFAFWMAERTSFSRTDIWLHNDLTKTLSRLTNDGNSRTVEWMNDGERVVWIYTDSAGPHVRRQRADGTGVPETLFDGEKNISAVVPSPAGNGFAVMKSGVGYTDLYYADGETAASLRPLVVTPSGEAGARISPDGRWITYFGDESGRRDVYVIATSGAGGRHQISTDGGAEPSWSPDGKTVFYRAGGKMVAAAIQTSPAFSIVSREALFADHFRVTGLTASYDVSRDGKWFLMIGNSDGLASHIIVVTGWLDELRERMSQAAPK